MRHLLINSRRVFECLGAIWAVHDVIAFALDVNLSMRCMQQNVSMITLQSDASMQCAQQYVAMRRIHDEISMSHSDIDVAVVDGEANVPIWMLDCKVRRSVNA